MLTKLPLKGFPILGTSIMPVILMLYMSINSYMSDMLIAKDSGCTWLEPVNTRLPQSEHVTCSDSWSESKPSVEVFELLQEAPLSDASSVGLPLLIKSFMETLASGYLPIGNCFIYLHL
jgi:hypothetical protein